MPQSHVEKRVPPRVAFPLGQKRSAQARWKRWQWASAISIAALGGAIAFFGNEQAVWRDQWAWDPVSNPPKGLFGQYPGFDSSTVPSAWAFVVGSAMVVAALMVVCVHSRPRGNEHAIWILGGVAGVGITLNFVGTTDFDPASSWGDFLELIGFPMALLALVLVLVSVSVLLVRLMTARQRTTT